MLLSNHIEILTLYDLYDGVLILAMIWVMHIQFCYYRYGTFFFSWLEFSAIINIVNVSATSVRAELPKLSGCNFELKTV